MYDYTTQYGVLDVPVSIVNPTIDSTIIDSFNGESGVEITIKEFLNLNDNNLIKYDIAISNPSFMMRIDKDTLSKDIYGRFKYGITKNSDWVVVSHILSTIKDTGKAAVLLPIGALFRGGAEERIRKSIIYVE